MSAQNDVVASSTGGYCFTSLLSASTLDCEISYL